MRSMPRVLGGFMVAMLGLAVVSTVALMRVENLSPLQAFYFAVVTMTTVGYGHIAPKTGFAMFLCVVIILGGVGIFSAGVGLITNTIISRRDREAAKAKVELLSEIFAHEVGIGMLERFTSSNPNAARLRTKFAAVESWSDKDFQQSRNNLEPSDFVVDLKKADFGEWMSFLESHLQVFFLLMTNPSIAEGGTLTNIVRRTYHLILALRIATQGASTEELASLTEEIEQTYFGLTSLWLDRVQLLRKSTSMARRIAARNPFETQTS